MSVLDAFVHDPLVEWEKAKVRFPLGLMQLDSELLKPENVKRPASRSSTAIAKNALSHIEKKLKGIHSTGKEKTEREIPTSSLVQILIQEATDLGNLVSGHVGLQRIKR